MPLGRYEIRNEYSLANPDLYRAAAKDDPEGLLEGVAMAGLVGIVRQLGDLAEFAAEVFHDLHEEILATAARGHGLLTRVQQLEAELPFLEKMMLSQTNEYHANFAYNSGIGWHAVIHNDQNHFTQGDLPRFIRNAYEDCRSPPRLFLLDKFDVAGAGACLKRYTDPSFFKMEWASSELMKAEKEQQDKRARRMKEKKKIRRQRNGEVREANFMSQMPPRLHVPDSDVKSIATGNAKPDSDVEQEAVCSVVQENGQLDSPIIEQEITQSNASSVDVSEDVGSGVAMLDSVSNKDSISAKLECDTKENKGAQKEIVNFRASEDGADDVASETENFVDALTTMDSEAETDSELRVKGDREFVLDEIMTISNHSPDKFPMLVKESEVDKNLEEEPKVNVQSKLNSENEDTCVDSDGFSSVIRENIGNDNLDVQASAKLDVMVRTNLDAFTDSSDVSSQDHVDGDSILKNSITDERIDPSNVLDSSKSAFMEDADSKVDADDVNERVTNQSEASEASKRIDLRSETTFADQKHNEPALQVPDDINMVEVICAESSDHQQTCSSELKDYFDVEYIQEKVNIAERIDPSEVIGHEGMSSAKEEASFPMPDVVAEISRSEDDLDSVVVDQIPETRGPSEPDNDGHLSPEAFTQQLPGSTVLLSNGTQAAVHTHFTSSPSQREDRFRHGNFSSSASASEFEDSENEQSESPKEMSSRSSADSSIQPMRWPAHFSRSRSSSSDTDDEMDGMQVSSAPSSSSSTLSSPRPSTLVTTVFNVETENQSDSIIFPSSHSSPVSPVSSSPMSPAGGLFKSGPSMKPVDFVKTATAPVTSQSPETFLSSESRDDVEHLSDPTFDCQSSLESKLDSLVSLNMGADLQPLSSRNMATNLQQPLASRFPVEDPDQFPPPPPLPPLQWRLTRKVRSTVSSSPFPMMTEWNAPPVPQNAPVVLNKQEPDCPLDSHIIYSPFMGRNQVSHASESPLQISPLQNQQASQSSILGSITEKFPIRSVGVSEVSRHSAVGTSGSQDGGYSHVASQNKNVLRDDGLHGSDYSSSHRNESQLSNDEQSHTSKPFTSSLPIFEKTPLRSADFPSPGTVRTDFETTAPTNYTQSSALPPQATVELFETVKTSQRVSHEVYKVPKGTTIEGYNNYEVSEPLSSEGETVLEGSASRPLLASTIGFSMQKLPVMPNDLPETRNHSEHWQDCLSEIVQETSAGSPINTKLSVQPEKLSESIPTVLGHHESILPFSSKVGNILQSKGLGLSEQPQPSVVGPLGEQLSLRASTWKSHEDVTPLQSKVGQDLSSITEFTVSPDQLSLKEYWVDSALKKHRDQVDSALPQDSTPSNQEFKTFGESFMVHGSLSKVSERSELKANFRMKEHPCIEEMDSLPEATPCSNVLEVKSTEKFDELPVRESVEESKPKFLLKVDREDSLITAIASHDRNTLKKVPERSQSSRTEPADDRGVLLEQIRNRSFSLRHTKVDKQPAPRPVTNINVAAILEKANAIRQAFAGSDEDDDDDDDWSDS